MNQVIMNLIIHFILIIITGDLAFRERGLWIVSCCCWIICFILDLVYYLLDFFCELCYNIYIR